MVVPCGHHEELCGTTWIFRRAAAEFPRADTNLLRIRVENGRNQKANFVCNNNAEGSRKTW